MFWELLNISKTKTFSGAQAPQLSVHRLKRFSRVEIHAVNKKEQAFLFTSNGYAQFIQGRDQVNKGSCFKRQINRL